MWTSSGVSPIDVPASATSAPGGVDTTRIVIDGSGCAVPTAASSAVADGTSSPRLVATVSSAAGAPLADAVRGSRLADAGTGGGVAGSPPACAAGLAANGGGAD